MKETKCQECGSTEFREGSDYTHIRPLNKKMSLGSNKIYTFCLNCGRVADIRIENPEKFK